jgi:transcriptional regulator with PAS, ATPase and Fis domain
MSASSSDASDPAYVRARAMVTLFERLEHLCEGAIAIDRGGRVIYVNEKYLASLGLKQTTDAIGRPIEEIIPNSLMRNVAETGEPILLDIMELGGEQLVVTRMPIEDEEHNVIGAIGFVLYDRIESLKPLLARVTRLESDLRLARRQLSIARAARFTLADFVGATPAITKAKEFAKRAARQSVTVLLTGETGTGKELLAQAIHNASSRAEKPFVSVNVAAIPETLIESEFFGTAPGAYTGADRRGREGKFRIADGGTLFLDEIGEMPLQLQAKLLRVLQERETSASSPRPTWICASASARAPSAPISTIASTCSRSICRPCANASMICPRYAHG